MSKLRNKIKQLSKALKIIEMYNYHYIMGVEKDIKYLKDKIKKIEFDPTEKFAEELDYCIKNIEMYYNLMPSDFIKQYNKYLEELEKEMV